MCIRDRIIDVPASMDGLLRGLIRDGYPVTKGFKIADIDPRAEEYDNCFTISDKARCIAGGVLEALLYLKNNLTADQKIENSKSIYADYAATHITKPDCVKDAMIHALSLGNSGRAVSYTHLDPKCITRDHFRWSTCICQRTRRIWSDSNDRWKYSGKNKNTATCGIF